MEAGVFGRQSALVAVVGVGASCFGVSATAIVVACVLGILCHARYASVGCRPYCLLAIYPPCTCGVAKGFFGCCHFAIFVDGKLAAVDGCSGKVAYTVVEAVAECPCALCNVKIYGKS